MSIDIGHEGRIGGRTSGHFARHTRTNEGTGLWVVFKMGGLARVKRGTRLPFGAEQVAVFPDRSDAVAKCMAVNDGGSTD